MSGSVPLLPQYALIARCSVKVQGLYLSSSSSSSSSSYYYYYFYRHYNLKNDTKVIPYWTDKQL